MSKSVLISTKENAAKIVVDGNEIHDVLSYTLLERSGECAKLILEIALIDEIEVQR